MNSPAIVGVDVGTTRTKCLIIDATGKILALASAATASFHPRPDWTDYDGETIWQGVCGTIRSALGQIEHPSRVQAIAVASFAESAIPIDKLGQPLDRAIAWFDLRTAGEFAWLVKHIGVERLFSVSGLNPDTIFGICKLLWFKRNRPEAFPRLWRWLNIADYVAFRLSGIPVTDYSLASRTLAFNLFDYRWETPLLREIGLSEGVFAELSPSGSLLGEISQEAADSSGLPRHTMVGVGGHDHIVGAFGAGTLRPGALLDSLGTSEALLFSVDQPVQDSRFPSAGLAQGVIEIRSRHFYVTGGIYTSGAAIEWFRHSLAPEVDYSVLVAGAEKEQRGTVCFIPHLRRSLTPIPDAKARGAFLGLTATTSRTALFRGILEGLAFEARGALEGMLTFPNTAYPSEIRLIGGNTANALFMRLKAAAFGRPINLAPVTECTSFGAALLAGLAAGIFSSEDDAQRAIGPVNERITPDPEDAVFYEKLYQEVYRHIYCALRPLNHRLHELAPGDGP
jgi:xylulokinase